MFGFSPFQLVLVGGIVLLLFGSSRLPDVMRSLGRSVTEFNHRLFEHSSLRSRRLRRYLEYEAEKEAEELASQFARLVRAIALVGGIVLLVIIIVYLVRDFVNP